MPDFDINSVNHRVLLPACCLLYAYIYACVCARARVCVCVCTCGKCTDCLGFAGNVR
jgi:hypothetical protein